MTIERQALVAKKEVYISCVVPVYNEEAVITDFITQLQQQLRQITKKFEIIVVDDGSQDATVTKLSALPANYHCKFIRLSRNFGKEIALTAGLEHSSGDIVIILDADFQHPIELISLFLQRWAEGYEMVYGVRNNRDDESPLKRNLAHAFYTVMSKITKINIPNDAGDFRLLDRKVVDALNKIVERGRFMKGLYAWVGFKSIAVPFDVQTRAAGKSSWKFTRLAELALTGITSFSDMPLRVWGYTGFVISFIALIYALYFVLKTLIYGVDVPGFPSILVGIMFFGGIQLMSIGILGEYIARIFNEVKQRPKYIIAEQQGFTAISKNEPDQ
jgi:glycosyltransferase involved in cell wall biosynthesis